MWGGNAIEGYLDDEAALRRHWKRLKPPVMTIMSDAGSTRLAQTVKDDLPETEVVFRPYHPQDHRWHEFRSAEEIWDDHRRYAADGLVVQIFNEPSGYANVPLLASKAAQVAKYARQEGKRVALPTFAVGHPGEQALASGALDPLLREMSADRRVLSNLWTTHEYGLSTTKDDPYRVGRVKQVLARAQALGAPIAPRRVAFTEYGRDVGGHAENDGWLVYFGGNQQAYFDWMLPGVELYRAAGFLGVCVFVYSRTWRSFDIQHALTLQRLMEQYNEEHPMTQTVPKPTTGGVRGALAVIPGDFVNIRSQPNAPATDLGDLHVGDTGVYFPPYGGWVYFVADKGVEGWVSLQSGHVQFAPELLPPDEPVVSVPLSTYNRMYAALQVLNTGFGEVKPPASGGGF